METKTSEIETESQQSSRPCQELLNTWEEQVGQGTSVPLDGSCVATATDRQEAQGGGITSVGCTWSLPL